MTSRPIAPVPRVWIAVFLLPCWVTAALGIAAASLPGVGIAVASLALAGLILAGQVGKYPALTIVGLAWLGVVLLIGAGLAALLGSVPALLIGGVLAMIATIAGVRIALPWGQARAAALARKGRAIREWEWVYTGRDFALSHPLARRLGGIIWVVAFIIGQWMFALYTLVQIGAPVWPWLVFAFYSLLPLLTVIALFRRHPIAWPLVWWGLLMGLPFSLPLIVYWADGVRPNLIYRHRFERLVTPGEESV